MKDNIDKKDNNNYSITNSTEAFKVLKIIGFVILGIIVAIGLGFVIMWLWNWLMPMIFGLTKLTYWQGLGVLALTSLLFGRMGGGGKSSDDSDDKKCKEEGKGRKHGRGIGRTIKDEIKSEIMKELDKEFESETDDDSEPEEVNKEKDNYDYDKMYDAWWADQGEKSFEEFMAGKENNTQ